jgi:uncharacterized protein (DUF58 family)
MPTRRLNLPWRHPGVEPGPITLTSRRLYILPTRAGLVYMALVIGVLLTASNYRVSLGYLFCFLLFSVGMAGLLHTQRNLLGITLRPMSVLPVYTGDLAGFKLHLNNPHNRLRGALRLAHGRHTGTESDMPGRGQTELEVMLLQSRRGYHRPSTFTLSSTWPLGLFRCWTVFALDWGVVVYPRPAPTPLPFPESSQAGDGKSAERVGDDDFLSLRNYHPGDSPSRIAWKSLARGLPPLTKQFAAVAAATIEIDWNAAPEQDLEARLSRLVRWVLDAERSGRPWTLRIPGRTLPPGRGDSHLKQALENLARHGQA